MRTYVMIRSATLAVVLAASVQGVCMQTANSGAPVPHQTVRRKHKVMKVYDALKIAIGVLRKHHEADMGYRLTVERDTNQNSWMFYFVFLPRMPSAEVTIWVADDGKTELMGGAL